jgi:hypothetical protein
VFAVVEAMKNGGMFIVRKFTYRHRRTCISSLPAAQWGEMN